VGLKQLKDLRCRSQFGEGEQGFTVGIKGNIGDYELWARNTGLEGKLLR